MIALEKLSGSEPPSTPMLKTPRSAESSAFSRSNLLTMDQTLGPTKMTMTRRKKKASRAVISPKLTS